MEYDYVFIPAAPEHAGGSGKVTVKVKRLTYNQDVRSSNLGQSNGHSERSFVIFLRHSR